MVKLAEAEYLENPHEVSPTTSDFRGHSLAFRVTLPVEIENEYGVPVAQGHEP